MHFISQVAAHVLRVYHDQFKLPDISQGFFLSTVWPGNFIKWQNNFVYSGPEKKNVSGAFLKKIVCVA